MDLPDHRLFGLKIYKVGLFFDAAIMLPYPEARFLTRIFLLSFLERISLPLEAQMYLLIIFSLVNIMSPNNT